MDLSKRFSVIAGYDHYFYVVGENNYVPYSNSLSITPALELKPFVVSTTYSFYFGDANAHRILPGINILMEKKKLFGLERITLSPSFYILFGDETITELEFIFPKTVAEGIQNFRKYGSWIRQEQTHKKVFGIMNYAVTLPISVTHKNWLFSFSYAYNIPRALPGEPLTVAESSYLSGSITRFLRVKRHKLAL